MQPRVYYCTYISDSDVYFYHGYIYFVQDGLAGLCKTNFVLSDAQLAEGATVAMASLKFIMDVDDDQPDPPPSTGDGRDSTRNIAPPHSSGQATPSQIYPSHVSGSDQATRQTSRTAIATVAGSRRAPASTRNSDAPSALTTAAQSSTRRRSTASNDSMDHAGYGSAASSSSVGAGLNPSNSPMRPMSSATSSDVPVKYTPITGRVSRARKGVPVHICEICRPPKVRFVQVLSHEGKRYSTDANRHSHELNI